ncbi:MAG: RagB/SusD family nutrient uptake outer membrane protein [Bacteroidota bacterium]
MKVIYQYILIIVGLTILTSCEDFLEEENRQSLTDANAFENPEVFDQFVNNVYNQYREAFMDSQMEYLGTDMATREALIAGVSELNDYVNIATDNGAIGGYWARYYKVVDAANTVTSRVDQIAGLTEPQQTVGLAEAKFFRAFAYFHLVEHFGEVPLIIEEVTAADFNFTRASEEVVYDQIITDVDEAIANLPEEVEVYGRLTKDAARHLKSKVLLTRGYKSFSEDTDFAEAASLAETVIANHPLVDSFSDLVAIDNQRNSEVVFSLLYGADALSQGDGNARHQLFKFPYDVYPGLLRSNVYGRGAGISLTPQYFDLFEAGDERESATLRRVIYALEDEGEIMTGDTAVFFPKEPWSDAERAAVPYVVVNEDEYYTPDAFTPVRYPMFQKFDDPTVPYGDAGGFRDAVIFRSGEAYLIAAEAYFSAGDASQAAEYINMIRNRAGLDNINANAVSLDLILNESAKELLGEISRWMDLKRTGRLIERVLNFNPHAALNNALEAKHLVRPIPQSEIDLADGITQNDGY